MMNDMIIFNDILNGMIDDEMNTGCCMCSSPDVDVTETDTGYKLEMDLPGRTEKDISVELDNNTLTISSAESENTGTDTEKQKTEQEHGTWLLKERSAGAFKRSFTLPDDVNGGGMTASFKNGVLTVSMPRAERVQPKRITVESAA